MQKAKHIHPIFDQILGRKDKEARLNQHACTVWMTGLSGSGKSTLARELEIALHNKGYFTQIIDGDNVRSGINSNLGFSDDDRKENIRRVAEISKLFVECGIITINSFVSPTKESRQQARQIIGAGDFIEVYVNAPLAVCEDRDVKGLYKKARKGEIKDFTGIGSPFEAPENPDIEIKTDQCSVTEATEQLMNHLEPRIAYAKQL